MTQAGKTPWHLWVVAGASFLWHLIPVSDYVGFKTKAAWYLEGAQLKPEQIAWIDAYPIWADIGWALGVWGAMAGTLLLLARSRHAVTAFLVSLVGLGLMSVYQVGLKSAEYQALFGAGVLGFLAVIWVVAIALFFYARAMAAKGVLR
ncbi:hypothetical protein EEB18_004390 [Sphingopyxis sp. OPL5]|uniref:hypothetical protein n=1 Tax=Sphingopyxis sp. OPL5 TaxID=2486273 RepID=UPI00164DADBF|nr:hypothetical protein [Sphingopyxis sp. OPL5]QNO28202.1 hypothetical protein EEB18_004390 [Sphingopyxis sp. OPL5]